MADEPDEREGNGLFVPLGVHIAALDAERTRRLEDALAHQKELTEANRAGDQLAVQTALTSAQELAAKHNDLIRAGERKDETYALKSDIARIERWQARLTGGMILLSMIGLGNFVKIWAG